MRWLSKLFKGGSSYRRQVSGTHRPPQFIEDENMVLRAPLRSLVNTILCISLRFYIIYYIYQEKKH